MSKPTRAVRQGLIAELLGADNISSQAELVRRLTDRGIDTTQVTVSRDLVELGAVKVPQAQGGFVYTLDSQPPPDALSLSQSAHRHLGKVLKEWVQSVDKSRDLVVLRTSPGAAHVVAAALDRSKHPAVMATLSGDDTVLVIVPETHQPAALQAELTGMVGLDDVAGLDTNANTNAKQEQT